MKNSDQRNITPLPEIVADMRNKKKPVAGAAKKERKRRPLNYSRLLVFLLLGVIVLVLLTALTVVIINVCQGSISGGDIFFMVLSLPVIFFVWRGIRNGKVSDAPYKPIDEINDAIKHGKKMNEDTWDLVSSPSYSGFMCNINYEQQRQDRHSGD